MRKIPLFAFIVVACAPAATVQAPVQPVVQQQGPAAVAPAPAPAPVDLPPIGYRPEFGTMWTFDAPPLEYWQKTYNFSPDQAWLDRVRMASIRLPNCSASFVSANGLVMTNQHCIRDCSVEISPPDTDYILTGFIARTRAEEKKCVGLYVDQLESIQNVTERVRGAITATDPATKATQRAAITAEIKSECEKQAGLTCQVVSLYAGGMYSVYAYRRFDDIRMVWVPEEAIAGFGGDPDNFTYPRYDLDAALLRVYVNGRPHTPQSYFRWSKAGAAEGEAVFVIGNPGTTGRLNTIAQMEYLRDVSYPAALAAYERNLNAIHQFEKIDSVAGRKYLGNLLDLENARKATIGYRSGLVDTAYMARKSAFENEFRARLAADPKLSAEFGGTYDAIASAQREIRTFAPELRYHGFGLPPAAGGSRLLDLSRMIVRMTDQMKPQILEAEPVDTAFERLVLAAHLAAAQSDLPASDPFVTAALGGRTPDAAAAALVAGTRIGDSAFRRSLVDGGQSAIAASTDPLIVLAREIDVLNKAIQARAARQNAVITANTELLGSALFATFGTALPPDATFTLRISDGVVSGYPMNGTIAPYKTTFMGMYSRSAEFDGKPPFNLSPRWIERMNRLDLKTPYNFVTTNDIIGGNSGSPMVNTKGEVVGLVFDGNIESLPNRFLVLTEKQRTVSVHSSAIIEVLRKMFDAPRVADELQGR